MNADYGPILNVNLKKQNVLNVRAQTNMFSGYLKQEFIIHIGKDSIQHCITLSKDTALKVMQYPA